MNDMIDQFCKDCCNPIEHCYCGEYYDENEEREDLG